MIKRRKNKKTLTLFAIELCGIVSLLSVGFAAWDIELENVTVYGTAKTNGVSGVDIIDNIALNNALTIDPSKGVNGFTSFAFSDSSFLDNVGSPTTTVSLTYYYVFDLSAVSLMLTNSSVLTFSCRLTSNQTLDSSTTFAMFDNAKFTITPTCTSYGNGTIALLSGFTYAKTHFDCNFRINSLNMAAASFQFSITYTFAQKSGVTIDFFKNVYSFIASDTNWSFVNRGGLSL